MLPSYVGTFGESIVIAPFHSHTYSVWLEARETAAHAERSHLPGGRSRGRSPVVYLLVLSLHTLQLLESQGVASAPSPLSGVGSVQQEISGRSQALMGRNHGG